MKRVRVLCLIIGFLWMNNLYAQIGYYDAPYTRYEADTATLANASVLTKSFDQSLLQSEASGQTCVTLQNSSASSITWTA